MVSTFLLSTVATGAVLVAVAVFIRRLRHWRHDKPESESSGFDALASFFKDPRSWIASYALLMIVAAGGVYVALGGAGVPESLANAGPMILGGIFAAAILVFVGAGTYTAVRGHNRSSSQAAGMGAFAVGLLLLAAIAVKLILA